MVISAVHSSYSSVLYSCDNNLFTPFSDDGYVCCFQSGALYKHSSASPFMNMYFLLTSGIAGSQYRCSVS